MFEATDMRFGQLASMTSQGTFDAAEILEIAAV